MMINNNCNICREIEGKPSNIFGDEYNQIISHQANIIYQSEKFMLIPSIGPLNDSHVMLVPKKHVNNFALLDQLEMQEANKILNDLANYYSKTYQKDLVFFESGAGLNIDHSGGCITHAHIHCVEFSAQFHTKIFNEIELKNITNDCYINADTTYGYVWYRDINRTSYICNNPLLPSQFLRYIYAESTKSTLRWNWRKDLNINGVLAVICKYREFRT